MSSLIFLYSLVKVLGAVAITKFTLLVRPWMKFVWWSKLYHFRLMFHFSFVLLSLVNDFCSDVSLVINSDSDSTQRYSRSRLLLNKINIVITSVTSCTVLTHKLLPFICASGCFVSRQRDAQIFISLLILSKLGRIQVNLIALSLCQRQKWFHQYSQVSVSQMLTEFDCGIL